jgi:hypothetical protein
MKKRVPNTSEPEPYTLEAIDYHRNGISGVGFYVVCFRWAEEGDEPRPMVATVFPEQGCVAVLDREQTRRGNIAFARGNSWRGDHFETWLRAQVKRRERASLDNDQDELEALREGTLRLDEEARA